MEAHAIPWPVHIVSRFLLNSNLATRVAIIVVLAAHMLGLAVEDFVFDFAGAAAVIRR